MTEAEIKIPYAIANFAELRERCYYYIDKTAYIKKLEWYKAPVFLRPKRFGNSLLVLTLAHYCDCITTYYVASLAANKAAKIFPASQE